MDKYGGGLWMVGGLITGEQERGMDEQIFVTFCRGYTL